MRFVFFIPLLVTVSMLTAKPALAQRAAIAPLIPRVPVVQREPAIQVALSQANQFITPVFDPGALAHWRPAPVPDPLFILNSTVVINGLLTKINPDNIRKLTVYKGADAPSLLRGLTGSGIIDIALKKKRNSKIKSLTLAEIGARLLLTGPVRYSVNGMPAAETSLRIATAAIGDIQITHATPAAPTALVNIQTTPLEREKLPPAPPGTIWIRGMASY